MHLANTKDITPAKSLAVVQNQRRERKKADNRRKGKGPQAHHVRGSFRQNYDTIFGEEDIFKNLSN